MTALYRSTGEKLTKTVPTGGVVSGDVNVLRSGATGTCGVWADTYAAAAEGLIYLCGEFQLASVNNAAFAIGDILYWDDTANKLTKVATANTRIGVCSRVKATTGATGYVLLNHY